MNFTKGQWQDIIAAPVANLLEFFPHPYHTITITGRNFLLNKKAPVYLGQ